MPVFRGAPGYSAGPDGDICVSGKNSCLSGECRKGDTRDGEAAGRDGGNDSKKRRAFWADLHERLCANEGAAFIAE